MLIHLVFSFAFEDKCPNHARLEPLRVFGPGIEAVWAIESKLTE